VAHCKVMGHIMVRSAKTAEPIDMTFSLKTCVGPRNHILDGDADPKGRDNFLGCPDYLKALAIFAAAVAIAFSATGITIQSPITSCSRMDYSVCQTSANSILKISGRRRCGSSAAKAW